MNQFMKHFDNHGFWGELFYGSVYNIKDELGFYFLDNTRDYEYGWKNSIDTFKQKDRIIIY